jgi:hypothetical protein
MLPRVLKEQVAKSTPLAGWELDHVHRRRISAFDPFHDSAKRDPLPQIEVGKAEPRR